MKQKNSSSAYCTARTETNETERQYKCILYSQDRYTNETEREYKYLLYSQDRHTNETEKQYKYTRTKH
jgi:hypothetical protein